MELPPLPHYTSVSKFAKNREVSPFSSTFYFFLSMEKGLTRTKENNVLKLNDNCIINVFVPQKASTCPTKMTRLNHHQLQWFCN